MNASCVPRCFNGRRKWFARRHIHLERQFKFAIHMMCRLWIVLSDSPCPKPVESIRFERTADFNKTIAMTGDLTWPRPLRPNRGRLLRKRIQKIGKWWGTRHAQMGCRRRCIRRTRHAQMGCRRQYITWPLHCNNATKKLRNKERHTWAKKHQVF